MKIKNNNNDNNNKKIQIMVVGFLSLLNYNCFIIDFKHQYRGVRFV